MRKLHAVIFFSILITFSSHALAQTAQAYQKTADGNMFNKNYQAAYDNYTKAIKKTVKNKIELSVLYYKRGESLSGLAQMDDAIKDFNTAISLNPKFAEAYWDRGVTYDNKKNYRQGLADFKKAISLFNGTGNEQRLAILYCNVAFDQLVLGKPREALLSDSLALNLNHQYGRAYQLRGDIYYTLKDYRLAAQAYTKAIFSYQGSDQSVLSGLYTLRADAQREAKMYKAAINDYSQAITLFPGNGLAYWNRGATYHLNSDYELAANDYTKAIGFYKGDKVNLSRLYDNRATNEIGQTLFAQAIADDSLAIALDSTNRNAYFNLANAYTQNADYQLGIDIFKKLIPVYHDQKKLLALLYFQIANNEYFLNEFDKVVDDCSKAIELDPGFSSSYYYRGKVYLKKMNDKKLAMADFNKVIELDTSKNTVNYIFGLFYVGRGDEGIAILQDNLLKTTDNALVLSDYYNLACLYALMNKPDEANIYLKKAIDGGYIKKYAIADEDLDNIRNTDDYKSTMAGTSNH